MTTINLRSKEHRRYLNTPHIKPRDFPQRSLNASFNINEANVHFQRLELDERIKWAHSTFGEGLVLSSSFGIQSALLLEAAQRSGLNIPVLSVDVLHPKYDEQRAYRDKLQQALGFDLYVATAKSDAHKVSALKHGLEALGATAILSGIRATQTSNRAQKRFIDAGQANVLSIHPILDWPDAKADYYLQKHPELLHPKYQPGVQSQGGAVLGANQKKTECGIHLDLQDGAGI